MDNATTPRTVSGLLTTPAFEPGAERRMAITLYSVLLPVVVAGFILQRYTVVIDNRTVGTFLTDDRGSADLELQEGETVPQE